MSRNRYDRDDEAGYYGGSSRERESGGRGREDRYGSGYDYGRGSRGRDYGDYGTRGSDMQGALDDDGLAKPTDGLDAGDSELDSDSDREGTGERGAAGRDQAARDGADIDTDHVERIVPDVDDADEEEA